MLKTTLILIATFLLISAGEAAAQTRPSSLSTIFDDVFGPNGLVVSSDDVQLDGTNHAAHFNSSFQSDFRLMNIALTSQLTAVPVPSPASGFTYKFDPSTGTFVRSTQSFGPILADRGETIGRGRIAFGTNFQFFSFDRLDGTSLSDVPAVFRHDAYRSTGGRSDVIATRNTIEATVTQFTGALTFGVTDRIDVSVAIPVVRTRISLLSNATIQRVGTGTDLGVHYFLDPAAPGGHGTSRQFFAERRGRRYRRRAAAREGAPSCAKAPARWPRASICACRPATSRTFWGPARSGSGLYRPVGVLRPRERRI